MRIYFSQGFRLIIIKEIQKFHFFAATKTPVTRNTTPTLICDLIYSSNICA